MGATITVTSSAFAQGAAIPARYTCGGADVSPPLRWSGAPAGAKSVALTIIDPDAPGRPFTHWVLFNLPPAASSLPEGGPLPSGSVEGRNDFGAIGYRGPCPPQGRPHHYHVEVYALDTKLPLAGGATEPAFAGAIRGHVVASGELVGTFKR